MLGHGFRALSEQALEARIELIEGYIPGALDRHPPFDAVMSNSLLHHLADPMVLWETIHRVTRPGAPVYVMDLRRPESDERARAIVEEHARDEPEVLRHDFYMSLHAAYTPSEVSVQLKAAGLDTLTVTLPSDRHLLVSGYVPGKGS